MTLTLDLDPDLGRRLQQAARGEGVLAAELALELLQRHLPPRDRITELSSQLRAWMTDEAGASEQRETGELLIRTLDEDRLSDRPLFPDTLKGQTW